MANTFKVNVYEINGIPRAAMALVLPTNGFSAVAYTGSNTSLYGELTIAENPFYVYGVIETPTQLQALAG